jgi:hypothetical protein
MIHGGTEMSSVLLSSLLVANGLASLFSAGSAVAGVLRPGLALTGGEPVTGGVRFYAGAYGVRAVPLGLVTVLLLATGNHAALVPVLAVAGLAQVGDSVLGVRQRITGMAVGGGLFAVLHLATACWLATR